jgi:hypothetical protein
MAAQREPSIVFCLIDSILSTCRESGATMEESIAALKAAVEIVPVLELQSKDRVTVRT